jgi:hypothetical protein
MDKDFAPFALLALDFCSFRRNPDNQSVSSGILA